MASISESLIQGLLQPSLNFQNLQEPLGMILGGAQAQKAREERQKGLMTQALGAPDMNAFQRIIEQARTPEERQQALSAFNIGQQQRTTEREQKRQVATELEQESELINARLAAQKIARSLGKPELADALKSAPMESVQNFIKASYEAQAKTNIPKVNSVPGGYTTTYPDGKVVFTASGETAEKATMPKVTSVVGGYTTTYPDGKVVFTETAQQEEEEKVAPLDLPPEINATETTIIDESLANASTATTRAAMARRGLEILSTRGKVRGPLVALRSKVLGLFGSRDELDTAYQDVGSMFKDEALQAYLPRPGAISNFELQWAEQQSKDPTTLNDKELDFFLNRKIDIEEARARYNQDKASHISKYGTIAGFNDIVMLKRSEQKIVELKKTEEYKVLDREIFSNPDLSPASKAKAIDKMKKNPEYADIIAQAEAAGADFKMYSERVNSFEARYKTKR